MNDNMLWAVNAPVPHNPKLARKQTWANSGGQTGIVGPYSLEVRAQETPNGAVQVLPGGFVMAATPGGSAGYTTAQRQSYAGDSEQTSTVEIRPTGSSGSRADVLGIVINDPEFEGTADSMSPEQWADHEFWSFLVVENAPTVTTARGYGMPRPFLPLARVTIPANTATITNAMITDLRRIAVRQTHTELYTYTPDRRRDMTGPGEFTETVDREIYIPEWATRLVVQGQISGMALTGTTPDVTGTARALIMVGDASNPANVFPLEATQIYQLDQTRWNRVVVPVSGVWSIPESRRGQTFRIFWRFNLNSRPGTLTILEEGCRFDLGLFFEESPTGINS